MIIFTNDNIMFIMQILTDPRSTVRIKNQLLYIII